MTESFEDRDLAGAEFWGVRLTGATFRDVDFTGVRTHHVWLRDVEFDGLVDRLVVNGVDVTDYVNANDPWQPLRGLVMPTTADEIRASLAAFTGAWDETIEHARSFAGDQLHESVDGEFSFVQTLQHLLFGADKWIIGPLTDESWQPLGLPNSGSRDFPWPGIDLAAEPDLDQVLAARAAQSAMIHDLARDLRDDDLAESVTVLENGTVRGLDCWHTLFEESFEHRRYALRDLAELGD